MQNVLEPFRFKIHRVTVSTPKFGQPVHYYHVTDVHAFSTFHDTGAFTKFNRERRDMVNAGERCVFSLGGDEIEGMSRSERQSLMNGNYHSDHFDRLSRDFKNESQTFADDTSYMAGRLLFAVQGNHLGIIRHGKDLWQNSTDYLVQQYNKRRDNGGLRAVNLGGMAMIQLIIDSGGTRLPIVIMAVHGETIGGGRTKGGSINAVVNLRNVAPMCTLYLAGHNHDLQATRAEPIYLSNVKGKFRLASHPQRFIRCGGYRRGYMTDKDNYVAKAHYEPAGIGTPEIVLKPVTHKGRRQIDIAVNGV